VKKYIKKKFRMRKKPNERLSQYEAVVVGVSSGGMEVLYMILKSLQGSFPLPLIIVQHMHSNSDNYLAQSLNEKCKMTVKEAEEKENIKPGNVYIAPPNYHLLIEDDRTFSFAITERVNFARPSIDVLFETAADVYKEKLIGIILTGANYDGSQGLKKIKDMGGMAIVQDPFTAKIESMPRAALAATDVDYILPPEKIGSALVKLVKGLEYNPRERRHKLKNN
jgi:two-component system chemotaxis response regulator CheB